MNFFERLFDRSPKSPTPLSDTSGALGEIADDAQSSTARAFVEKEFGLKYRLEQGPDGNVRVYYLREGGIERDSATFLRDLDAERKRHEDRARKLQDSDLATAEMEQEFAERYTQMIAIAQQRIAKLRSMQPINELPRDNQQKAA